MTCRLWSCGSVCSATFTPEDEALAAILAAFDDAGVGMVLSVGDIVDGPGDVERTISLLREHDVIAVRGNHDRWILEGSMRMLPDAHALGSLSQEGVTYLASLPVTRVIPTPLGGLFLCHGVGHSDMQRLLPEDEGYALTCNDELQLLLGRDDLAFMVGGHTHRRMLRRIGKLTIVNPGTLYREHEPGAMILDCATKSVRVLHAGNGAVVRQGESVALP
jgi:predicted phosphodiesterase